MFSCKANLGLRQEICRAVETSARFLLTQTFVQGNRTAARRMRAVLFLQKPAVHVAKMSRSNQSFFAAGMCVAAMSEIKQILAEALLRMQEPLIEVACGKKGKVRSVRTASKRRLLPKPSGIKSEVR